ncbi:MAG TPA: DEAD/DEAH box helicase, partial [Chitinophagaceae bacterium]|nr:DEAD/DEAH box helicase [Chitinophagaceae bacterium]
MSHPFHHFLAALEIESLNPMQESVLKEAPKHDQLILLSNTGSGKTIAFLFSLWQRLQPDQKNTQALIVAPSRELVLQIESVVKKMRTGLKCTVCYGGHKRETEEINLVEAPVVIIGTAGRLADHIRRGTIQTSGIHSLVLDEYDKLLELGFEDEMKEIVDALPSLQFKMLTSATSLHTFPEFLQFNQPFLLDHRVQGDEATDARLEHTFFRSAEPDKIHTLVRLISFAGHKPMIVFCNHRDAVERVALLLREQGIRAVFYHGGMEQYERESELALFRNHTSMVLVTTDLAARGLDIPGIRYIVHYHLPDTHSTYTHRNGRTARMHDFGQAVLILSPGEKIPAFIEDEHTELILPDELPLPERSEWSTLHLSLGKKEKVNRIDIVGFLSQRGELKKDDLGLIEVKDHYAFA